MFFQRALDGPRLRRYQQHHVSPPLLLLLISPSTPASFLFHGNHADVNISRLPKALPPSLRRPTASPAPAVSKTSPSTPSTTRPAATARARAAARPGTPTRLNVAGAGSAVRAGRLARARVERADREEMLLRARAAMVGSALRVVDLERD
jgi:hypothetical protein